MENLVAKMILVVYNIHHVQNTYSTTKALENTLNYSVGTSPLRKDGYDKVTGHAEYVDDLIFPNCLYGKTVRSTIPRGRIIDIQFDPTIQWSSFIVVTAKDIPSKNVVPILTEDEPFLADQETRYIGEPILLLAHQDQSILEHAVKHIKIIYSPLPAIFDMEEVPEASKIQYGNDNIFKKIQFAKGDVASAWAKAEIITEGKYQTGAQEHAYIEPQGMIATASKEKGVIVWGSLQCPYYVHKGLAKLFGLPDEEVCVVFAMTGGAFGGKEEFPTNLAGHAALLSWKAGGRPVKMIYSRDEDMLATTKRHPARTYIKSGFTKEGKLIALDIKVIMDGGAYVTLSPVVLSRGVLHSFGPYLCPNVQVEGRAMLTNSIPYGAFRGFGAPQTIFALERHFDEVAKKLNISPIELRYKNFLHQNDTMATGQQIAEKLCLEDILAKAITLSDYSQKIESYQTFNRRNTKCKKGIGIAVFFHGSGFTGSGEVFLASKAGIKVHCNGMIELLTAQTEMGQGAFTTLCQIVADELKLPYESIFHAHPDTRSVPNSGPTVASRTCMIVGGLLQKSARDLRRLLVNCANLPEDYTPDEFKQAILDYRKTKGELVIFHQYQHPPEIKWDDKTYTGSAYAAYAWAAYVADIEIDLVTYQASVHNFVAVQDIGKAIHPIIASGQIEGGVVQGIGWCLLENVMMENGAMKNNQLSNYIIPTTMDVPNIRVFFFENPYHNGPFGAKGLGELPMDGPAAAIANAMAFALNRPDIHSIPLLPEKILELVESAEK